MENNKHKIENIEDIFKVVNKDNKDNFLKDFSNWLDLNITIRENLKGTDGLVRIENNFVWIDDGKNDIDVTLDFKEEIKEQ